MSDTKKEAKSLLKDILVYLGHESKEETTEAEVKMEETKEETTEVKFASELAEGEYELKDGTMFKIDAEGNVVDVVAPTEDEAETEETAKDDEDMEAKENLSKQLKEIEDLKAKVTELSKVKPVSNAPKKTTAQEPIQLTSNMTSEEKQEVRRLNRKSNK